MRISERHSAEVKGGVDFEAGLIRDVQILGPVSKNGRRYRESAMIKAAPLYESAPIHFEHSDYPDSRVSTDEVARIVNPRFVEGRLRGDIDVFRSHANGPLLLERAHKIPGRFGLSHVVEGELDELGEEVVRIEKVVSVDAVRNPATNTNIYESEKPTMKTKIATIVEALDDASPAREPLANAIQALPKLSECVVEIADEASPADKLQPVLLESLLQALAKLADPEPQKQVEEGTNESEPSDAIKALMEDVAAMKLERSIESLLISEGVEPSQGMVEELAELPNDDARRLRIREWPELRRGLPPVIRASVVSESESEDIGLGSLSELLEA